MRRINIRQATGDPNLVLPLVDERGAFVLAAGKPLTAGLARRLWERGFRHAYVESPGFEDIGSAEPLQPKTYSQLRRLLTEFIDEARQTRPGDPLDISIEQLHELVASACDELTSLPNGQPFTLYPSWEGRLDAWLSFAINGAVLAGLLGLQRDVQAARRLFMAALVQDVGLWRADRTQDHVQMTQEILRPMRELGPVVRAIAAEHHELLDGSGYPEGKTGERLHQLSRIMNVVVAYLGMIGSASKPVLPHEALEGLMAGTNSLYDETVVHEFRKIVHTYPPGTVVRLSNGRRGVVLHPGPAELHRPRVRLLPSSGGRLGETNRRDASDEDAKPAYDEIDLATELSVTINRVLD